MSYDWSEKLKVERFSKAWFDQIDARFVHASRLFATDTQPFDRVIPFHALAGKRVLEIGCGMGLHSELMARAGAIVSAVDISPTSIEATQLRFSLKGLKIDIAQADAQNLSFDDDSFDFVWSWGVIHHSAKTAKVVREISRVTKANGECRIMVYNRNGIWTTIAYLKEHLLKGKFLHQDFDSTLLASSDGFHARFYTPDQFADLFYAFFNTVSTRIFGQESDAIPLPRRLRPIAMKVASEDWLRKRQSIAGYFLFLQASDPY